jgi:O-succinylbenzoic acid--CoA ligase
VEGDTVRPVVDDEGWFHTGDLGSLDNDGYLIVHGRRDTMFISGGENIHPEAIEAVLSVADGVERAVVVGVPDEEFGHRPVAFVAMADGRDRDAERLADHVTTVLPRFMIPARFHPWPESLGQWGVKPDRTALTELAVRLH